MSTKNKAAPTTMSRSMYENEDGLRSVMRRMMSADDDVDAMRMPGGSLDNTSGGPHKQQPAFVQSRSSAESEDAYVRESAASLSAVLGPRWNAREIEDRANQNTRALLNG